MAKQTDKEREEDLEEEEIEREDEDLEEESEEAASDDEAEEEPRDEGASDDDGGTEGPIEKSSDTEDDGVPAILGATKYVHAAFFAAGILVAFLSGKILGMVWNRLAEWPAAVRAVPTLLRYGEDERPTFTMALGALIAVGTIIYAYRKPEVKQWADDVAIELSKVTWPDKELVTNGTVVVCIASVVATAYIALLDRFWGFVTTLVYGV